MKQWTTYLSVPESHPSLAGHFPGQPIVPGVLLLDLIFAAIEASMPQPLRLDSIPSVKFLQPMLPGDVAELSVTMDDSAVADGLRVHFRVARAGTALLDGVFLLTPLHRDATQNALVQAQL